MSATPKQPRASRSQTSRPRKATIVAEPVWVKAKVVANFLSLSEGAIYRGEAGTEAIRTAFLPGTEHKARPSRRWLWEDVLKIHSRMLAESAPKEEAIPANILKLFGRGRRR